MDLIVSRWFDFDLLDILSLQMNSIELNWPMQPVMGLAAQTTSIDHQLYFIFSRWSSLCLSPHSGSEALGKCLKSQILTNRTLVQKLYTQKKGIPQLYIVLCFNNSKILSYLHQLKLDVWSEGQNALHQVYFSILGFLDFTPAEPKCQKSCRSFYKLCPLK